MNHEKITEINSKEVPAFYIKPELDKYNDVILFPEKLKKAKESIKNSNLVEFLSKIQEELKEKK